MRSDGSDRKLVLFVLCGTRQFVKSKDARGKEGKRKRGKEGERENSHRGFFSCSPNGVERRRRDVFLKAEALSLDKKAKGIVPLDLGLLEQHKLCD
ncbi:hypothetical protein EYF80_014431 [Liparis tanakae]|uniref:Uncharacterized protein n=1 Tax=Liparis tanakae TaxID=230148 RepID=A0A4Z2IDB9_9TELE|nr:hypothetical protein EYF80_014431 [Liparis tanakae]